MAGTVTQVHNKLGHIKTVVFTCTADAGAATFPDTAITGSIDGFLVGLFTNPGATAPTDNYDITLEDSNGIDVLGGAGGNRHTTASQMADPVIGTYNHPPVSERETYTLKIANNAVNSAITVITLYYSHIG